MNHKIDPNALFRLSVLGPLASREQLSRGELKKIIQALAAQTYQIPNSYRVHLAEKTIERWYYRWKKAGIDGLANHPRSDKSRCHLASDIQEAIVNIKKDNPSRSINTIIKLLETQGVVAKNTLSRSTVHRLLSRHDLSRRCVNSKEAIERRAFEAEYAGDLWYGDVMHGPRIQTKHGLKKVYLVSIMDDASRLICHSCFCFDETALSIEYVLKDALLKRGLPKKLMVDNGPAYRSASLQGICARLKIRLLYSRPYEPQSKGKLERWHRTLREQFLSELILEKIQDIQALNARLWTWIERIYHDTTHSSLKNSLTPQQRYHEDLLHVQPLDAIATHIDEYFYHRVKRCVKKDGTISYENSLYEVAFDLVGKLIYLVVEPHAKKVLYVESLDGERLGAVFLLNKKMNNTRQRNRPTIKVAETTPEHSLVENIYEKAKQQFDHEK
jgi:transposase InsO family protein